MIRIGLDTNILAYLAGVDRGKSDGDKINAVRALLRRLVGRADFVVSTQAYGEVFVVLTRSGASRDEAREIIQDFQQEFAFVGVTPDNFATALNLAADHQLQMWDSIIIATTAAAGCTILLSEDMQHGFRTGSLFIINPFNDVMHERLAGILK